jgi:hypothetical protein
MRRINGFSLIELLVVIAIMMLYLLFAVNYALNLPPGAGPDENEHIQYLQVLREYWRIPLLPGCASDKEKHLELLMATHPPGYYLLLAGLTAIAPGVSPTADVHLLRLVSVAMAVIALVALAAALRLQLGNGAAYVATPVLLALLPQYNYMTGVVNNTTGEMLWSALALYALAAIAESQGRQFWKWMLLGCAVGGALITKLTSAWLLVIVLLCLRVYGLTGVGRDKWRTFGVRALVALVPATAAVAFWLLRSHYLYGMWIPESVTSRRLVHGDVLAFLLLPDLAWAVIAKAVPQIIATLAVPFWLTRPDNWPTWWVNLPFGVLVSPAVVGFLRRWWAHNRSEVVDHDGTSRHSVAAICLIGVFVSFLITVLMVSRDLNVLVYAGRFMMSALPMGVLVWAIGVRHLVGTEKNYGFMVAGAAILLLGASVFMTDYVVHFYGVR